MKKLRERTQRELCPLYNWAQLACVFTNDMRQSEKLRGIKDCAEARTLADGPEVVMLFNNKPTIEAIAHESVHAATYILRTSEVKASLVNDEPIAYLVDWLTGWVSRNVKKRKTKRAR